MKIFVFKIVNIPRSCDSNSNPPIIFIRIVTYIDTTIPKKIKLMILSPIMLY